MAAVSIDNLHTNRSRRADGITTRFWQATDTPHIHEICNDSRIHPGAAATDFVPRTENEWNWAFHDPANGQPPYIVALHGGRLIGTQAYIPIPLRFNGHPVRSGKDEETLVHPQYRGRGVLDDMYSLMIQRAERDGVAMLWGFTNTAVRPLLRNGFQSIGTFDALRLDLRGRSTRTASHAGALESSRGDDKSSAAWDGAAVIELSHADPRLDDFAAAFAAQVGGITLELSRSYLDWRVFRNPCKRYMVFAAIRAARIRGLGIFKYEDDTGIGYISDLAEIGDGDAPPGATVRQLMETGLEFFNNRGLRYVVARPSGPHPFNRLIRELLMSMGFKAHPATTPLEFLVRSITCNDPRIFDFSQWRICELMRLY